MHNFQPQNANKLQLLVETPSKFLITNDHLFWKWKNSKTTFKSEPINRHILGPEIRSTN